jgi:hypothetical protein
LRGDVAGGLLWASPLESEVEGYLIIIIKKKQKTMQPKVNTISFLAESGQAKTTK